MTPLQQASVDNWTRMEAERDAMLAVAMSLPEVPAILTDEFIAELRQQFPVTEAPRWPWERSGNWFAEIYHDGDGRPRRVARTPRNAEALSLMQAKIRHDYRERYKL